VLFSLKTNGVQSSTCEKLFALFGADADQVKYYYKYESEEG